MSIPSKIGGDDGAVVRQDEARAYAERLIEQAAKLKVKPTIDELEAIIALSAPPAASAERGSREPIKADNVNGCAICGCGSTEFRVGLQAGAESSNHIRVLECVHCQHQMPVPFQQGGGYRKRAAQGVGE